MSPSYTEFSVGGGLLDDANVKFTNVGFERYDYNGKADPIPAFHATLVNTDTDEESDQYWSAGNLEDWEPSEDGTELVQVGAKEKLAESSNFVQLLVSLANAGFDKFEDLEKDITMLEDMEAHVVRQKMERKGLKKKPRADGREYDQTVLTVDEILVAPWEKDAKKGGAKKTAAKKTETKDKGGDDELIAEAQAFVMSVLSEKGEVQKKELSQIGFKSDFLKDSPNKNAIIKLVFKDDFLGSIEGVNYEDGKLTLAD